MEWYLVKHRDKFTFYPVVRNATSHYRSKFLKRLLISLIATAIRKISPHNFENVAYECVVPGIKFKN